MTEKLTPKQLEIFKLYANGCATSDILEKMNITYSTLKSHTSEAYAKLDVNRPVQAVAKLFLVGEITADEIGTAFIGD